MQAQFVAAEKKRREKKGRREGLPTSGLD